jgi:predicted DCC family thiol-disulfide oxidoreductase YuxK
MYNTSTIAVQYSLNVCNTSEGDRTVTTQLDELAQHFEPYLPVVFFDGGCPLCRGEIAHYRRIDTAQRMRWVDAVNEPEALGRHGLSLEAAMAELHVLDGTGRWQRGIDAFLVIWQHLPAYRWLAKIITALGLRRPLAFAYRHFAAWRNRRRCSDQGCAANSGR